MCVDVGIVRASDPSPGAYQIKGGLSLSHTQRSGWLAIGMPQRGGGGGGDRNHYKTTESSHFGPIALNRWTLGGRMTAPNERGQAIVAADPKNAAAAARINNQPKSVLSADLKGSLWLTCNCDNPSLCANVTTMQQQNGAAIQCIT